MAQSDNLLTEDEKVQIRHHLGYMNQQENYTFVLGTPTSVETQFIIEGSFNTVMPQALGLIRRILVILNNLEAQMVCDAENLAVRQVGDITLNVDGKQSEQNELNRMYERWCGKLCNALGVYVNPFDRSRGIYPGRRSMNGRVG